MKGYQGTEAVDKLPSYHMCGQAKETNTKPWHSTARADIDISQLLGVKLEMQTSSPNESGL